MTIITRPEAEIRGQELYQDLKVHLTAIVGGGFEENRHCSYNTA
jgi:hypothetical protein